MYGQYTKDLSDFARIEAARVKLTQRITERLSERAKKPQNKLATVHRLKGIK